MGSRDGARYDSFRRAVKDRDGWRCRDCGRPGRLEVHHVRPIRERPDLATDPDNCLTLCAGCHLKRHRRPETDAERRWREFAEGPL